MVFCNQLLEIAILLIFNRHNPYFNRWFSAISMYRIILSLLSVTILILIDGFLQFHSLPISKIIKQVTILILIDGFLQSNKKLADANFIEVTILILIDGFLQ